MNQILILDNYDSFTYNLVHLLRELGASGIEVVRNDKIALPDIERFDAIVLSPGPGLPREAGIMPDLVTTYAAKKKILGVCLGHQCIAECFGAKLENLQNPVHGKATPVRVINDKEPLFKGLPGIFNTGRYHSWVVSKEGFPVDLEITALDNSGEIMALAHKKYNVRGVQFHPESVLTEHGAKMMKNWMTLA